MLVLRICENNQNLRCLTEDIDEAAGFAGSQVVLHGAAVGADDAGVGRGDVQAEELAVVLLLVQVLLLRDLHIVNVPGGCSRKLCDE